MKAGSRLAVCSARGERMYCQTAPYVRKDGSKRRTYRCGNVKACTGVCDAKPVDAEAVDTAVMERLHDLLPDFERWIEQIEDRHASERERLALLVERAEAEVTAARGTVAKHEKRYRDAVAADDDTKADLMLEFVQEARRDLEAR